MRINYEHVASFIMSAGNAPMTWVRKTLNPALFPRVKLNHLQSLVPRIRHKLLGRGTGSGRGDSCGRGEGGQKATNRGSIRLGFEGGQQPFYLRAKKHGFKNVNKKDYQSLNLAVLQHHIDKGRLDTSKTITMRVLQDNGVVGKIKDGVKLLDGGGEWFTSKIKIEVTRASRAAIKRVEAAGGEITTVYHNKLNMRAHLKPHLFHILPRSALPKKKDMKYYLDPRNRGYLLTEAGKERLRQGGLDYRDGKIYSLTRKEFIRLF